MNTGTTLSEPQLGEEQQLAVDSPAVALVVLASAGSGKTEVVARRIQRLLQADTGGTARVLALTYTVKASDELRQRLTDRLGALADLVDCETLHGFAHNLIRTHGTRIGLPLEPELLTRDEDRAVLFTEWLTEQGRELAEDPKGLFAKFDLARAEGGHAPHLAEWRQALDDNGALDYPALIDKASELLGLASVSRQVRRLYSAVIVDEAQNLTRAQYRLLETLLDDAGKVIVPTTLVGDDKQSIVSFAGASPSFMEEFAERHNAELVRLSINYRSATTLAQAAGNVAANLGHEDREQVAFAAQGSLSASASRDEAAEGALIAGWVEDLLRNGIHSDALSPGEPGTILAEEIVVLSRAASGLRQVAEALDERGIKYALASTPAEWLSTVPGKVSLELVGLLAAPGHKSTYWELARLLDCELLEGTVSAVRTALNVHPDPMIRALEGLLDLSATSSFVPYLQSVQVPSGLPDNAAAGWAADVLQFSSSWQAFDRTTHRVDLTWINFKLHCARTQRGDELAPGVRLLTVHKAQGREYLAVAVVGLNDGQFPDFRAQSTEALKDELRTFYVAITRARRVLLLSRSRSRMTRYGSRATQPSPFLEMVRL